MRVSKSLGGDSYIVEIDGIVDTRNIINSIVIPQIKSHFIIILLIHLKGF